MASPSIACRTAIACSVHVNEQTIRLNDFKGDHDTRDAVLEMMSRSWVICGWAKMAGLVRFVMRIVLVGLAG
jgi:hypothetical protein